MCAEPTPHAPRFRILLVEDDAHLRKVLSLVLGREGFEVACAADGSEGLDRACADDWDLILTDTMMPRMTGIEMLERLRGQGRNAPPVIIVSAAVSRPGGEELARLGVRRVVAKPFGFDHLLGVISEVLSGRNR